MLAHFLAPVINWVSGSICSNRSRVSNRSWVSYRSRGLKLFIQRSQNQKIYGIFQKLLWQLSITHTHTHTRLTALCPGLPRSAGTRKVKPICILLKQQTVSGSGICWAIFKYASRSRQPRQHPTAQFLQAGCPSWRPTNSVKALKETTVNYYIVNYYSSYCELLPFVFLVVFVLVGRKKKSKIALLSAKIFTQKCLNDCLFRVGCSLGSFQFLSVATINYYRQNLKWT